MTTGVLWTPMRHFADDESSNRELRICYSAVGPDDIDEGISRLTRLIRDRLAG